LIVLGEMVFTKFSYILLYYKFRVSTIRNMAAIMQTNC